MARLAYVSAPPAKMLSQEHGVSHITAEKALTKLRDGLIHSVIGKGYYVKRAGPRSTVDRGAGADTGPVDRGHTERPEQAVPAPGRAHMGRELRR